MEVADAVCVADCVDVAVTVLELVFVGVTVRAPYERSMIMEGATMVEKLRKSIEVQ